MQTRKKNISLFYLNKIKCEYTKNISKCAIYNFGKKFFPPSLLKNVIKNNKLYL